MIGREKDLARIDELVEVQTDGLTLVLITGMAGVGKSELALQYAKSKVATFKAGVAQFSAANFLEELQDFVMNPYTNIAGTTDLRLKSSQPKTKARLAWDLWAEFCKQENSSALIVIDDVTDYQTQIADFLPKSRDKKWPFQFVLTSRERWGKLTHFELTELELDAAVKMFRHFVGEEQQYRLIGKIHLVKSLCTRLGCLPLALALAGSVFGLGDDSFELETLMTQLERDGLASEVMQPDFFHTQKLAEEGLEASFQTSWTLIAGLNASAQQLAKVISLFAPTDLPWKLMEQAAKVYPVKLPPQPQFKRNWVQSFFGKSLEVAPQPEDKSKRIPDLERARWALCRTSLLREVKKGQVYRLHPLIHEFFTAQWQNTDDPEGWQLALVKSLSARAGEIPAGGDWEQVTALQVFRPHFRAIMKIAEGLKQSTERPKLYANLKAQHLDLQTGEFRLNQAPIFAAVFQQAKDAHQAMKHALARGQRNEANQHLETALQKYERAIELGKKALPENSLTLAGYLLESAQFHDTVGHYEAGIISAEKALTIVQKKGSKKLISLHSHYLARLYRIQGKYEAAEPLFINAIQTRKELLGDYHPSVATSINSLAVLYKSQGKYEAAELFYLDALQMWKKLLGDRHPDVATSLNNLAALYQSQGKYEAAEPLLIEALQMRKELLGDRHPDVAGSMNNLAVLYKSQGKYEAAEPLYLDALQMRKELLGDRHPDVAQSMNNLAALYQSQGKYEAAEPLYLEALQMRKELLDDRHPDVADSWFNIATLYHQTQRNGEASEAIQTAISIYKQVLGAEHPTTQNALGWLQEFEMPSKINLMSITSVSEP